MGFYNKEIRWTDAGVILSALIITKLIPLTSIVDQQWLQTLFTCFLYFIDFSIFLAVIVGVQGKGGVAIFYLFRAGFLLSAEDHSISNSMMPAIVLFMVLRGGEIVLDRLFMLSVKKNNNSSVEQRDLLKNKQQIGKYWFQVLIGGILLVFMLMTTYRIYGLLPGLLLIGCLVGVVIQLIKMTNMPDYNSRQIQNSLHFNVYVLLGVCCLISYKTSNSFTKYLIPAYIHLNILLLYSRLFISCFTSKFHSLDSDLFYAIYPYTQISSIHTLMNRKDEGRLRVAKAVDKLSRQLAWLIYVLGVCLSSIYNNPIWIGLGVIAVNLYQIQNRQTGWQALIEDKLKIKINLLLSIPLVIFYYSLYNQQLCTRQIIESIITNCNQSLQLQMFLCGFMVAATLIAQAIRVREYKIWLLKGVAILCPIILLVLSIGLECQNLKTILISIYSLAICVQIIRQDRRMVVKHGKHQ